MDSSGDGYDLYIHQGDVNGPVVATSATGAPNTSEMAEITPTATGTGLYTVHVVYFSASAADQYHGSATTTVAPTTRIGTYIDGATLSPPLAFSANKPLKAPVTNSDGEPSNRTDLRGNAYIGGIRGFPAGVDLWYYDFRPGSPTYDPKARNPFTAVSPMEFLPSMTWNWEATAAVISILLSGSVLRRLLPRRNAGNGPVPRFSAA